MPIRPDPKAFAPRAGRGDKSITAARSSGHASVKPGHADYEQARSDRNRQGPQTGGRTAFRKPLKQKEG